MDKYAVWVKASETDLSKKTGVHNGKLKGNEKCLVTVQGGKVVRINFSNGAQMSDEFRDMTKLDLYILDESPVDRGVEKAAEGVTGSIQELAEQHCRDKDYSERQFEIGEESFIAGAKLAANDAVEFAEWVEENYVRLYSEKLKGFAWVNCKENEVLVNGSDYHYTTLINKAGLTTEQLYKLFKGQDHGK